MLEHLIVINNKYYLKVRYFSRCKNGRVYPTKGHSLGSLRRVLRHYLAEDIYYDIDMINAHPNILRCVCLHFNIKCDTLIDYCENREKHIKRIIKNNKTTRDIAKKLFIAIINGGDKHLFLKNHNLKEWKPDKFVDKFDQELQHIRLFLKDNTVLCLEF